MLDWLDWALEVYELQIIVLINIGLVVWVVLLEHKWQQLQKDLERTTASAESFRKLAKSWGDALQESRQTQQPTVIPYATMIRISGDNAIVLAEVCLN